MNIAQIHTQIDQAVRQGGGSPAMANFLRNIMNAESGGNVRARNNDSSAKGIFQFIDSTWQAYGGGDVWDVATQCRNVVRLTLDNERTLRSVLGRNPTAGEYYLAHFAGPAGARAVLEASPNTPISTLLGARAMRANSDIQFRGTRFANLTAGQLRGWAAGKMDEEISLSGGGSPEEEHESRRRFLNENRDTVRETTGLSDEQIDGMDVMSELFKALFMAVMSKVLDSRQASLSPAATLANVEAPHEPLPSPSVPDARTIALRTNAPALT